MATSLQNTQKFCLEHMVRESCSNPACTFSHYERQRVRVIAVKSDEGFAEGHLSYIPLCRFYPRGLCRYGKNCRFRHEIDITLPVRNKNSPNAVASSSSSSTTSSTTSTPYNNKKKPHVEQSKDKTCGICFEVIIEKAVGERKFGILPNCIHCYCIRCISKWRKSTQFEHKVIKACPECRITSDFVFPSYFWVEKADEKNELIENYKKAMSIRHCKYFKRGAGKCPFGNKCFYMHAYPDGRVADVGPPRPRRNRSGLGNITNADIAYLQQIILWNVIDGDDDDDDEDLAPWELAEELEDLAPFFSDSDSDLSDFEYFFAD